MAESVKSSGSEPTGTNPRIFRTTGAHQVTCIAYIDTEGRLATASVDHRLRVYEYRGSEWILLEKWRGHDAEVFDASRLKDDFE